MSILLVADVFPPAIGGSGRWLWELYRRLPRRDILVAAGEHPQQDKFDRTHDMRVARLPLMIRPLSLIQPASLVKCWRVLRDLRRLIKSEPIEMLHCACVLPEGLMALALKIAYRIPFACYAHGEEFEFALTSRELTWLTRRVLRNSAYVIANSRNTERILIERWGLPASRIRVMHPGVDPRRFDTAPSDQVVRSRLGWGSRPVILTVARLQKGKGHDMMIQATRFVRESIPEVLYAIVGDGGERPALESLVADLDLGGHVQFLGELEEEELIHCYQQCDLFVLPNRQVGRNVEGFGIVLLEAQACGKPVIAGTSGGTAETMDVEGSGLVLPTENPRELAGEVVVLLKDRDRMLRMGEAARSWVVAGFDWDVLARQARQLFGIEDRDPVPDHLEESVSL